MRRWSLFLLVASLPLVVHSEIRDFEVILKPDSKVVHYSEGYLVAPGYIDLSDLKFSTLTDVPYDQFEPTDIDDDAEYPDQVDDAVEQEGNNDDDKQGAENDDMAGDDNTAAGTDAPAGDGSASIAPAGNEPGDGGGRSRSLVGSGVTQLDIAILHLPGECANTRSGCDWTELGIGARSEEGDVRWCCSTDAVELGLCEGGPKYGSLIVNQTLFKGNNHRYVEIPPTGKMVDGVRYGKIEEPNDSGRYIVVLANCNDQGREVLVTGSTVWKSRHGYLPGELFGFMYFYLVVTIAYFVLMGTYGFSMKMNEDSRIPLEKWIFGTIIMGLLETFFRTGAFFVWNEDGQQLMVAVYIGKLNCALCTKRHLRWYIFNF